MVDHQSKELIDNVARDLKIQPAMQIPKKVNDSIQLVYNVLAHPERIIRVKNSTASDSVETVMHTTSPVKDTFLLGVSLTIAKDVLATSTASSVVAVPLHTVSSDIIRLRYEPLTAGQFIETVTFPIAIQLDRGSEIKVINSTAVGSIDTTGLIYFYETDPL